jgi:hypothetical protein
MPKTNSGRSRVRASKTSSNPKTATPGNAGGGRPDQPSRAHRDDTPEARRQARGTPKTHPNQKTRPGRRKDK